MNILLSLLIYNPVETYVLILLCDIINGHKTKFTRKTLWRLYLFSLLNFVVQISPYIWYGKIVYLIGNIVVAYIITPFTLKWFYVKFINNKLTTRQAFVAVFIYCIFAIVVPMVSDAVFKTHTLFYNNNNLHEFIVNFIIFFLQITLYKFIEKKGLYYEKFCKENRRKGNS